MHSAGYKRSRAAFWDTKGLYTFSFEGFLPPVYSSLLFPHHRMKVLFFTFFFLSSSAPFSGLSYYVHQGTSGSGNS